MDPVSIEEIKAMSPEEIRELKRKAVKNMLVKIVLPKIAISVAIAVASHVISKAINDKLDSLDEDDSDESEDED
jgi:hypothetical protein